jgi:hypothetical protein
MGWSGSKAPQPDPRMGEASLRQIQLAEREYEDYRTDEMPWMRSVAERALGVEEANAARASALSDYQLESMKFNDQRYRDVGIPFEDRLLEDVNRFDSAGYKQGQINAALADVNESFDNVQAQGLRSMARRSVNPESYNFIGAATGGGLAKASAMASAANKTRMAADQIGLSTKMQMYGGMKGLANLGATSAGLAINSMGTGNQSAGAMTGTAGSYLNANNNALATYNSGVSQGVNGMAQYGNLGIQAAKVNNDANPAGTIIGAAAQIGAAYL